MTELAAVPASVIDAYGAARLLTFDVDPATREPTVEVAHEALLRHWPRLRAWLDEDRDGLRLHRHLSDAAMAWEAAGRPAADLYRGARLESAAPWSETNADSLTPLERGYLQEARRRARRGRRLARGAVTAISALLVVALVAAVLAFVQQRRADDNADEARSERDAAQALRRDADTRRLVAESGNVQTEDLALSLLLAREANDSLRRRHHSFRAPVGAPVERADPRLPPVRSDRPVRVARARRRRPTRVPRTDRRARRRGVGPAGIEARRRAPGPRRRRGGRPDRVAEPAPDRRLLSESDTMTIIDTESDADRGHDRAPPDDVERSRQTSPAFLDDEHLLSFEDEQLIGYDLASGEPESSTRPRPRSRRSPSRARASSSASRRRGRVPDRHRRRDDLDHHRRAAGAAPRERALRDRAVG